jgi:hypothetical protein
MRRPFDVPPRAKEAGKLAVMLLLVSERARFWLLGHILDVMDFATSNDGL